MYRSRGVMKGHNRGEGLLYEAMLLYRSAMSIQVGVHIEVGLADIRADIRAYMGRWDQRVRGPRC